MDLRRDLIQRIWHNVDPFEGYPATIDPPDLQGWGSNHPYLTEAVERFRSAVVVEIGVWKGGSVATLASAIRAQKIDGVVIAVDTWLGSSEHWRIPDIYPLLEVRNGLPQLYDRFMKNMISLSLTDLVLPLPLDSTNASIIIGAADLKIDLLHIDAGHDFDAVYNDLRHWWPLLKVGGLLIGDDYNEAWPGVVKAFDLFFSELGVGCFEHYQNKCRIMKTSA